MYASKKSQAVWIASVALAVVFMGAGAAKLAGLPLMVEMFQRFGLPHWVLLTVGVLEILGALLLLNGATRPYAATGLAVVMIGASLAHVMTGVMPYMLFFNAALCFAAGWVLMQHRPGVLQVRRSA